MESRTVSVFRRRSAAEFKNHDHGPLFVTRVLIRDAVFTADKRKTVPRFPSAFTVRPSPFVCYRSQSQRYKNAWSPEWKPR